MSLEVEALDVRYRGGVSVLKVDALRLGDAGMTAIIGPNGAGKSSLLKAALDLAPRQGEVRFWGQPLADVRHRVAYVAQRAEVDWSFPVTVREVVQMGRFPYLGWRKRLAADDHAIVDAAIAQLQLDDYREALVGELSGGLQQRTMLARAVAQRAELLLLDEPLAALDSAQRRSVLALLEALQADGKRIVCVHHQLADLEAHFSQAVLLDGELVAQGSPSDVLEAARTRGWLSW